MTNFLNNVEQKEILENFKITFQKIIKTFKFFLDFKTVYKILFMLTNFPKDVEKRTC